MDPTDHNGSKPEGQPSATDVTAALLSGVLGRLASVDAAGDMAILTLAIASLTPIIEGSMAFVASTTAAYDRALTVSSHQDTQAYATVAQSVNLILEPRTRVVAANVTQTQPEPLAVS